MCSDVAYGSSADLVLSNVSDMSGETQVSYFQTAVTKHVVVAGESGDSTKVFKLSEFVDLPEISDPIFRNSDLIEIKATAEIDAHTHAVIERDVQLISEGRLKYLHYPDLTDIEKLVEDAVKNICFGDDCIVTRKETSKNWCKIKGEESYVDLEIKQDE